MAQKKDNKYYKGIFMKCRKILPIVLAGCIMQYMVVVPVYSKSKGVYQPSLHMISNGDTYEYTSIDKDGNIKVIEIPEINEEEVEKQQLANADYYNLVLKIGSSEEVIGTYSTLQQAESAVEKRRKLRTANQAEIKGVVDYSNIKYGVVNFRTKSSNQNTNYQETKTNRSGYTNGSAAADGAFLGYCDVNKTKIKFRQAGVEGCVNSSEVSVIDYDDAKSVNFYRVEQGNIYHYITLNINNNVYASTLNLGPAQSYMKANTVYYSYDGHYFYEDYKTMIDDYKQDNFNHSINKDQPYYNYFQFLSHRSKTQVTKEQFDQYTLNKTSKNEKSKMRNMGQYFIEYQDLYGANALLMYGVAANESAYGTSNIAQTKNNLFGHKAYDSDTDQADVYSAPQVSIKDHAMNYISDGYLDPRDYAGRYYGGHLGDKASGMNVKYASDPYWGEKAAAVAYGVVKQSHSNEFGKYQIGIVSKMTNLNVRKDATSNSKSLYMSKNISDFPILILSRVNGENINGNTTWYKIQSDPTLKEDRSESTQGTYTYDYDKYYGYVSSEFVSLVNYSNHQPEIPDENPIPPKYKVGDVNHDGSITSIDYVLIKNHILNIKQLDDISSLAADVNKDNKITSIDYVLVKNHILGISEIK